MSLFGAFVKETCTVSSTEITLTGAVDGYLPFDEEFAYDTPISYSLYNEEGTFYSLGVGWLEDSTTIIRRDLWTYDGVFAIPDIVNETVPAGTYYVVSTPHQYSTNDLLRPQNVGIASGSIDEFSFTVSSYRTRVTTSTNPGLVLVDITADLSEPLFTGQRVELATSNVIENLQVTATGGLGIIGGDVGGLSPFSPPVVFEALVIPGVGYAWTRIDGVAPSQADWDAGTSTLHGIISPAKLNATIRNTFNASGDAPMFACRAWANVNATGTLAIRGSGNISSITDHGAGDYTVNFTTAMEDANYAINISSGPNLTGHPQIACRGSDAGTQAPVAGSFRFRTLNQAHNAATDPEFLMITVFR